MTSIQKPVFVDKPTFETDSFPERIKKILEGSFLVMPWNYLARRDLLIENEISFPNIIRDDSIWSWNLIFSAKKFLRVPNAIYVWRGVKNSITRVEKTPQQKINFWLNSVILGLKTLNETLNKFDFFKENPQHHYVMLNDFINGSFINVFVIGFHLPPFVIYEAIKQEFGDKLGEQDVLVPFLCTAFNTQQKNFAINQQKFNQFAAQAQNRIKELEEQLADSRRRVAELEAHLN